MSGIEAVIAKLRSPFLRTAVVTGTFSVVKKS